MDIVDYRLQEHEKRLEAQDAKMDRIETALGELRVSVARIDARLSAIAESVSGLRPTVILTGLGSVALVVAILAYGQTWFGLGVSTRDLIRSTIIEMRQDAAPAKP